MDGFDRLLAYLERMEALGIPLTEADDEPLDLQKSRMAWPLLGVNGVVPLADGIPSEEKEVALLLEKLKRLFEPFLEVMIAVVGQAPAFLEETFDAYPQHQPHMALFLAFLNVLKLAQDDLNGITKRHLDFYYKQVLQLTPHPEVADRVHLILSLAQNFDPFPVETSTVFDAKKDADGLDLLFASAEEIVVNNARLHDDGLKTVFLNETALASNEECEDDFGGLEVASVHAASDADADEFKADNGLWSTLGSDLLPSPDLGFAIASPMLLLSEGVRTVDLAFRCANLNDAVCQYSRSVLKSELKTNVKVFLTSEEGWEEVTQREVSILLGVSDDRIIQSEIVWRLELPSEFPSVVPYDEAVHEDGFKTELPVAKFILDVAGLGTDGDLEFNIAAGIDEHEEKVLYFPNDFVTSTAEGAAPVVYMANGEVYGDLSANDEVLLWEETQFYGDSGSPEPYEDFRERPFVPGDLVCLGNDLEFCQEGNDVYRAIAEFEASSEVSPRINPTLWDDLTGQELPIYNPRNTYDANELVIVESEDLVFRSVARVLPLTPDLATDDWRKVSDFIPNTPYAKDEVVLYPPEGGPVAQQYFIANAGNNGVMPPNIETKIWEELPVYSGAKFNAGNPVINVLSRAEVASGSPLFVAQAGIENVRPGGDDRIWTEITYNVAKPDYKEDDIVGYKGKVYRAQGDPPAGLLPDSTSQNLYEDVTFKGTVDYGLGAIVGHQGVVYEAVVDPPVGHFPGAGDNVWDDVSYDDEKIYAAGELAGAATQIFRASINPPVGFAPGGGEKVWTDVTFNDAVDYAMGAEVGFNNSLFTPNVDPPIGVTPDPENQVWDTVTYKTDGDYVEGSLVGFFDGGGDAGVYRSRVDGPTTVPTDVSEWEQTSIPVRDYSTDSGTTPAPPPYGPGVYVELAGEIYLSKAPTGNIAPGGRDPDLEKRQFH